MPRCRRGLVNNCCYHVTTRGNGRQSLFRCDIDRKRFLKIAIEALGLHKIVIYNYCLMGNHIHFLVRVNDKDEAPLFFKLLFQRYAAYFRKRYGKTGHFFENRYKSILIEKDSYLLDCARYIERNPLRAGIVKDPAQYIWSSYKFYAKGQGDDIIKEPNPMYVAMLNGNAVGGGKNLYEKYVIEERPYEVLVDKGLGMA